LNKEQFLHWCQERTWSHHSSDHFQKPLIMGILNITPNSFFDGGCFVDINRAVTHALKMISHGVDIIDVGGESTNPGVEPLSLDEELSRVIPVIERIRQQSDVCLSIDTYKSEVMQAAVSAGASLINDIQALTGKGALVKAAQLNVPVCLMHMQGTPKTMQVNPHYSTDIIEEINQFFSERIQACIEVGIPHHSIILDPGFGFGKTVYHNLRLVHQLRAFGRHKSPLLLGISRKSTIGQVLKKPVGERLSGGLATTVYAALQGVAIIRTHDVDETNQALQMVHAIVNETFDDDEEL